MNAIATSGVWILWLIYVVASIILFKKIKKQRSGGEEYRDRTGDWHPLPKQMPVTRSNWFWFWVILTAVIIGFSIIILWDY